MDQPNKRNPQSVEVIEVDAEGRPTVFRVRDLVTGEWGRVEMQSGYRKPSVAHAYDPMSGLGKEDQ